MSLHFDRLRAHRTIDQAAGEARLRYITDVPGQQAVYLLKLQQALTYKAAHALDAGAAVPPYMAAEAAALGQPAIEVANTVIDLATVWNDQVGPAIEGARMGGKAAVSEAETAEDVEVATAAALAVLAAI